MDVKVNQVEDSNKLSNCENVKSMTLFIEKYWNVEMSPKGYNELVDSYTDFDGMSDLDTTQMDKDFKGLKTRDRFPTMVSAPHVAYNEKCQGKTPLHSLTSAIFSYSFECGAKHQELNYQKEFKNTLELYEKLSNMKPSGTPEEQVKELQNEMKNLIKDVKRNLYFGSVVTDHTKLNDIE